MPITLITGTPGAGKTLFALERCLDEIGIKDRKSFARIREQLLAPADESPVKRPLVLCGVEGVDPKLFNVMDDPFQWTDYEDGTLFLIDEVWNWFGKHCKDVTKLESFLQLAKHRHRGFDFVLTAQMPSQLHPFLLGLVNPHIHVTRKFGTKLTVQYEWPSVVSNPKHTIKRKLPLRIVMIPIVGLGVLGAIGGAGYAATSFVSSTREIGVVSSAKGAVEGAAAGGPYQPDDPAEPAKPGAVAKVKAWIAEEDLRERVPMAPWSAPLYDGRKVVAEPEIYCVAAEAGPLADGGWAEASCRCITDQGTRYPTTKAACEAYLADGGVYNPYRKSISAGQQAAPQAPSTSPGAVPAAAGEAGAAPSSAARPYGAEPLPSGTFALDPLVTAPRR